MTQATYQSLISCKEVSLRCYIECIFRSIPSTCSGINRNVDGFPAESLDGMPRNQWSTCSGMTGRLGPEYACTRGNKKSHHSRATLYFVETNFSELIVPHIEPF